MLSDSIKITEKIIEENNIITEDYYQQDIKYKLLNILENIFEIDSEEKNTKRRNSFNSLNISINKNFKNEILKNKKNSKNIEGESIFNLISSLKKSQYKKIIKDNSSLSIKTKEKTEKENENSIKYNLKNKASFGKNSNLSFKSYKTFESKNFILKSKLYKLNIKDNPINNKNEKKFEITLTQKRQNQEELNNFDCNLFNDNENDNKLIASNTYMDNEEENEQIKLLIN